MTQEIIPVINVVDNIGIIMRENLTDIRDDRDNAVWIFPTFPETSDNHPEVVIELENLAYLNASAGNNFREEQVGSIYKIYYYKLVEADLTCYVLTDKLFKTIVTIGGEKRALSNKLPNLFISNDVKHTIQSKRELFLDFLEDIKDISIGTIYEDTSSTWVAEVKAKVKFKDVWVREISNGNIIADYALTTNTI